MPLPLQSLRRAAAAALTALAVGAAMLVIGGSAHAQTTRDYVALGDSVPSGYGAGAYDPASGACKRSPNAYPRLWAASHRVNSFRFMACAGAVTSSVRNGQVSALNAGTDFVTITIGANDASFEHVMTTCRTELTSDNHCLYAISQSEQFIRTQLPGRLDATYRAIKQRAPHARVWVVGYPRLFTETNFCGVLSMSNLKRHKLNLASNLLNSTIRARVAAAGFRYVDVQPIFANHGLCSGDPWIVSPSPFLGDIRESYHPTARGHRYGYLQALTAVTG